MNILLVCASGMSSGLLASKIKDEIKRRGLNTYKVGHTSLNNYGAYLSKTDILVLAPQVAYIKDSLKFKAKIYVISGEEYASLDAEKILDNISSDQETHKSNFLYKISNFFDSLILIKSLNKTLITLLPITFIGSVFSLLSMAIFLPDFILDLVRLGQDVTLGLFSVYLAFIISYYIGEEAGVSGGTCGLFGMITFFILSKTTSTYIDLTYLGTRGIFTAIFIGYSSSRLIIFLLRLKKVKDFYYPKNLVDSFMVILPGLFTILFASSLIYIINLTSYDSFAHMVDSLIIRGLENFLFNNVYSFLFFNIATNILWFFGIHGGRLINSITNPIYMPMALENIRALTLNKKIPNLLTNRTTYIYNFGGAGSTLGLVLLMLKSKSKKLKKLGRFSIFMSLFGINEYVLYGVPLIYNFLLFIPFVFIGPLCGLITLLSMKVHLIPYAIGYQIPWTTPIFINGFVQGGLVLVGWQVLMVILSIILWFPFFKLVENKEVNLENNKLP